MRTAQSTPFINRCNPFPDSMGKSRIGSHHVLAPARRGIRYKFSLLSLLLMLLSTRLVPFLLLSLVRVFRYVSGHDSHRWKMVPAKGGIKARANKNNLLDTGETESTGFLYSTVSQMNQNLPKYNLLLARRGDQLDDTILVYATAVYCCTKHSYVV